MPPTTNERLFWKRYVNENNMSNLNLEPPALPENTKRRNVLKTIRVLKRRIGNYKRCLTSRHRQRPENQAETREKLDKTTKNLQEFMNRNNTKEVLASIQDYKLGSIEPAKDNTSAFFKKSRKTRKLK